MEPWSSNFATQKFVAGLQSIEPEISNPFDLLVVVHPMTWDGRVTMATSDRRQAAIHCQRQPAWEGLTVTSAAWPSEISNLAGRIHMQFKFLFKQFRLKGRSYFSPILCLRLVEPRRHRRRNYRSGWMQKRSSRKYMIPTELRGKYNRINKCVICWNIIKFSKRLYKML